MFTSYIIVYVYQLHPQRWTLQHGTTTASYVVPFGVESAMEFVRVVGKSSTEIKFNAAVGSRNEVLWCHSLVKSSNAWVKLVFSSMNNTHLC